MQAAVDRKKKRAEGLGSLPLRRATGVAGRGEGGAGRTLGAESRVGAARRGGVAPRMLSSRAVRVAKLERRRKHREPRHGAGGERRPGGREAAGRGSGARVRALVLGPGATVAGDSRGRPLPAPVARALQVSARGARAGRARARRGLAERGAWGREALRARWETEFSPSESPLPAARRPRAFLRLL